MIIFSTVFSGRVKYVDERLIKLKSAEDISCPNCEDISLREILKLLGETRNYTLISNDPARCFNFSEITVILMTRFNNRVTTAIDLDM